MQGHILHDRDIGTSPADGVAGLAAIASVRRGGTLLRKTAAVLGGVSGVLHLAMLAHAPFVLGLIMALAAISCLPCAGHLWRHASLRTWTVIGAMNLLMVVLHLSIMAAPTVQDPPGLSVVAEPHAGHHQPIWELTALPHGVFHTATAVACTEVVLCSVGLWLALRSSHRGAASHGAE